MASPFFGDFVMVDDSIPIPKRFQTSNFSKAKGFFYKKKNRSNRFYLTDFGCRKLRLQFLFKLKKKVLMLICWIFDLLSRFKNNMAFFDKN